MKSILIILTVVVLITSTSPANAGWFGGNQAKEHQLETQLHQQQESTGNWQLIAFFLGIGCVGTLVAGAAIGSKGRRNAKPDQP